jgi:hypothetical protein
MQRTGAVNFCTKKIQRCIHNIVLLNGTPKGIRTPVAAVRGRSLNHLTMGACIRPRLHGEAIGCGTRIRT